MTPVQWQIPVVVTDYGCVVYVTAYTKAEAIRLLRDCQWDEVTDGTHTHVMKVGPCTRVER